LNRPGGGVPRGCIMTQVCPMAAGAAIIESNIRTRLRDPVFINTIRIKDCRGKSQRMSSS
jgi:hypothetical protein